MSASVKTDFYNHSAGVIPPIVLPRSNVAIKSASLRSSDRCKAEEAISLDDVFNANNQNNSELWASNMNTGMASSEATFVSLNRKNFFNHKRKRCCKDK